MLRQLTLSDIITNALDKDYSVDQAATDLGELMTELESIRRRYGIDYPRLTRLSASVKGVRASANLYSLIETAKANALEPFAYLRHLFTELPKAETVEAIEALLPGNLGEDQIRIS